MTEDHWDDADSIEQSPIPLEPVPWASVASEAEPDSWAPVDSEAVPEQWEPIRPEADAEEWEPVPADADSDQAELGVADAEVEPKKSRKTLAAVLLTAAVLLLAWGAFVGVHALRAARALQSAAAEIPGLEQELRENPQAASGALATVQEQASVAARATGGPIYGLATYLPFVGNDLGALRTVSNAVHLLSSDVFPKLASAVEAVNPATLAPVDGRIDLAPLINVRDDVVEADAAVSSSLQNLREIDRDRLIGPLADATGQLESQLTNVSNVTATAARAVRLIPPMLGADGPREWIVLAQTNSEQRSLGGIVGAVLSLRTDDGRVEKDRTVSNREFPVREETADPILPATEDETLLFAEQHVRHFQNITDSPDFPRAAEIASAWWTAQMGQGVDGAIAFDPVALQTIIGVTGDVTFTDPAGETVTLTGDNTAEFLLSDVYQRYPDPLVQDAVFAMAAGTVFDRILDGGFSANALIDALDESAQQGRLLVWSAHPEEQELLQDTILGGSLRGYAPLLDGQTAPEVGVFESLNTASKLGFYLNTEVAVDDVVHYADGSQDFSVIVTIHNSLTPEIVASLPDYVRGNALLDGTNSVRLHVFAPLGGGIEAVFDSDGNSIETGAADLNGLSADIVDVTLQPGETVVVRYDMWSGPGQTGPVQIRQTPGI